MAFNFPLEMYMQVQQQRNKNQEDMNKGMADFGQGIGGALSGVASAIKQRKQQEIMDQLVQAMNSQGAVQQGPALPGVGMTKGQPAPNSGMGAPPLDNTSKIQSLMMQLNPEQGLKSMFDQQDPLKKQELLLKRAQTDLYKKKANDPGKQLTDIFRNMSTGEIVDDPSVAVGPEWKKYSVGQTTGLQTITSRGAKEAKGWDTASPEDKDMAKALYEGRIRPQDTNFRERGTMTKLANEYAIKNHLPPFKAYAGEVAAGTAKSFATGKFGQNTNSLNTALGHVSSAYEAFQDIQNTDAAWVNKPINVLKQQTDDPNVVKLGITLNALQGELASVFKGTGGTDQEIATWQKYLNENLTPAQVNAAIPQIDDLLRSRLSALDYQRSSGMSGRGEAPLLSPKGAAISKKFGDKTKTDDGPKPGTIEDGYMYMGGDRGDPKNWKKS